MASYSRNRHLTDIFREAYFAYIPINVKLGHFRIECLIRSICENGLLLVCIRVYERNTSKWGLFSLSYLNNGVQAVTFRDKEE